MEECQVSVVASQVRGYGLWDGGVARGGTLLAGWEGPAPSLLFLWVTDAQANLLQKELSSIQTSSSSSSSCFSGKARVKAPVDVCSAQFPSPHSFHLAASQFNSQRALTLHHQTSLTSTQGNLQSLRCCSEVKDNRAGVGLLDSIIKLLQSRAVFRVQ